ncbi:MAG: serine/threonine-protein kinase [Acidobacteriaceae bacterium]
MQCTRCYSEIPVGASLCLVCGAVHTPASLSSSSYLDEATIAVMTNGGGDETMLLVPSSPDADSEATVIYSPGLSPSIATPPAEQSTTPSSTERPSRWISQPPSSSSTQPSGVSASAPSNGSSGHPGSGYASTDHGRSGSGGSHPGDEQEMAPGTLLAGRYRIVAPVGRGGMGRVYRAEDLKLGQTVALKFLPPAMSTDPAWLGRFLAEVRTAREVTHPNVCRVHDIVEIQGGGTDGIHFLTMEYVDGENLSALLKRFGRLPTEKALQMARQITAGLAAAHARGVLHRDLKPANVMVDGRGQTKITDFGLAIIAMDSTRATEVAGTPGFMAPELFTGGAATGRSDLYSLGLVLYELLTGKPAYKSKDPKTRKEAPVPLRRHSPKVPADVEHIVMKCLQQDPTQRPSSAAEVLKEFPLVDELEAAIARGETPSPDMLAAAATEEPLQLWKAWALLGVTLLGAFGCLLLSPRATLLGQRPPALSTDDMNHRAQEILRALGLPPTARASSSVFVDNAPMAEYISEKTRNRDIHHAEQGSVLLTYRLYDKGSLLPIGLGSSNQPTQTDPAMNRPGMISLDVDSNGNLIRLVNMPHQDETVDRASLRPTDYAAAFAAAGLDPRLMHPIPVDLTPPSACDEQREWEGIYPGHPETPIKFMAAAWYGKFVYLRVVTPWNQPISVLRSFYTATWGTMILYIGFFLTAFPLARRNLQSRRGDLQGATTLSLFIFSVLMLASVVGISLTNGSDPTFTWMLTKIAYGLLAAALTWLGYVAMEPFARKRVPRLLVSSTLLLQRRFTSPTLARDLLLGVSAGAFVACFEFTMTTLLRPHLPAIELWVGDPSLLDGVLRWADTLLSLAGQILVTVALVIPFFIALRVFLKHTWLASVLLAALVLIGHVATNHAPINILVEAIWAVVLAFLVARVGMVAAATFVFIAEIFERTPWTMHLGSWMFAPMAATLAVVLALALYSFYIAIGEQRLFGFIRFED